MTNSRKLKIHTKHQARAYGATTTIPEIRLEGKWLDRLGFKQGKMVIIDQKKNKLTITVDKGQK
ncbi:SymE family type I addiction module toxin [Peijinzhouia sedimentorum]